MEAIKNTYTTNNLDIQILNEKNVPTKFFEMPSFESHESCNFRYKQFAQGNKYYKW